MGPMQTVDSEEPWVVDPRKVHPHVGHDIEIVTYADRNLAIECVTCSEVLADIDFSGDEPEDEKVEIVEAVGGRWMVLVNGFQWGPPTSTPDASGAYPDTFPTRWDAVAAYFTGRDPDLT
jgi:hypothetical protein